MNTLVLKDRNNNLSIVYRIVMAICLLTLSGKITIPIGVVPITTQTLCCYLLGILLHPKEAMSAGVIWMTLGLVGLPVFSLTYKISSFGFVFGMVISMYFMHTFKSVIKNCILSYIITSICGIIWLSHFCGSMHLACLYGIKPFIAIELLKIIITCNILNKIRKIYVY